MLIPGANTLKINMTSGNLWEIVRLHVIKKSKANLYNDDILSNLISSKQKYEFLRSSQRENPL